MTARLVTIPSSDSAFRRVVSHVLAQTDLLDAVETRVRRLYPRARVRSRELANEPRVLYVYRDGAFEPDRKDRWWLDPQVARVWISLTSGLIEDANQRWEAAVGSAGAGRSFLDFVHPEAQADARVLLDAIVATGEMTSEVLVQHADGTLVPLEFHAQRIGDRVEVDYRPLEAR